MAVFYDYFSAPDDRAAASAFAEGPEDAGFDTVCVKAIDPAVLLSQAVALLVREPFSRVIEYPRFCDLVTSPEAENICVLTLPDEMRDALAAAPCERLAEICIPWAQAEEFHGATDPGSLADFLNELAAVAGRARPLAHRLYCRVLV
ncbi:hypothetical protein H181DRAFT_05359 [Streptomyces sp. WMMB 714]|uniref:hypothetical protein n=1 Tax=Streptomyces sp. WMMB 714 TaxID=1286822 RepID=UPI0005F8795E|nr:hypothetical protein [Streptomyces sp. WMMB 714]SCK57150.1 hypothetical protein H181DRAFT_05359 [Streptomyces sp. WMMB 714]